jgi:8-oxo-dGTP pyrophosphatase MutT (NUDIX family)
LVDAYKIVDAAPPEVKSRHRERGEVVAAVCYRRDDGAVELLLVKTKGGKRWTFPKGHIERGERPWEAAAREALEEAGVEGEVAPTPFTLYRYPSTRNEEGESLVSAFLLGVVRQRSPEGKERHREPTWVGPDEATRLLAGGGREPQYAEEHERVVREAVAILSRPA